MSVKVAAGELGISPRVVTLSTSLLSESTGRKISSLRFTHVKVSKPPLTLSAL